MYLYGQVSNWASECVWVTGWVSGDVGRWLGVGECVSEWKRVWKTRKYIVPGLPGRGSGDHGTPGRISDPRKLGLWQCTFIHVCRHVKQVATHGGQGRVYIEPNPLVIYIVPHLPGKKSGIPGNVSQVISPSLQPWTMYLVPRQPRKKPGNPRAGHTSNPLLIYIVICLSDKRVGRKPKERQDIHPTRLPWQ